MCLKQKSWVGAGFVVPVQHFRTMSRTVYHVVPRENGKWAVIKTNAERAASKHRKKSAAVRKAKRLVKRYKPSELLIHGSDGSVNRKHSYGKDSFPPKG